MPVTIYHNPRCSKSRATLAILEEKGIKPEIVEYLNTPPDADTLANILGVLGMSPGELMRKGEDEYKAAKSELAAMSDAAQISWLCSNPRVIERPIVVSDKGACIGRPPENVNDIV